MEAEHYTPTLGISEEEILTEDGKHKYWRPALPIARVRVFPNKVFNKNTYTCVCGKNFNTHSEYELHYRKAYYEEEHINKNNEEK